MRVEWVPVPFDRSAFAEVAHRNHERGTVGSSHVYVADDMEYLRYDFEACPSPDCARYRAVLQMVPTLPTIKRVTRQQLVDIFASFKRNGVDKNAEDFARSLWFALPDEPKAWHNDGDECVGVHCANPEHGRIER